MRTLGHPSPGLTYLDRPGAYGICIAAGRVAVCRTPTDLWLPGGGIEPGESPEDALERELREELGRTGVRLSWLGQAAQYVDHPIDGPIRSIGWFWSLRLGPVVCAPTEDDHTLRFVSPTVALRRLTRSYQRLMVRKALSR
jgi:8-oxo-dGTP diphosphatase